MKSPISTVCQKMACKLHDLNHVVSVATRKENLLPMLDIAPWQAMTLSYGYPGLICLYTELHQFFPNQGSDKVRHFYVGKLVEEIKTSGLNNPSLFMGTTGVCLSLHLASENTLYPTLRSTLHSQLLKSIRTVYLNPLHQLMQANDFFPSQLYDLMAGVGGAMVYLLHYAADKETLALMQEILNVLVYLTDPRMVEKMEVPGWFIPSKFRIPDPTKPFDPAYGCLDAGVAHGIAGSLAVLAKAWLKGVTVAGHREAMEKIIFWLKTHRRDIDVFEKVWPGRPLINPSIQYEEKMEFYHDGWCYGAPSISISLLLTACALKDKPLYQYAVDTISTACARFPKHTTLHCPSFCHGLAGLLTMYHQMYLATGEKVFADTVKKLQTNILDLYDDSLPFGFKCQPGGNDQKKGTVDNPGLLDGSIGIILSLLFSQSKTPRPWLEIFLLN